VLILFFLQQVWQMWTNFNNRPTFTVAFSEKAGIKSASSS